MMWQVDLLREQSITIYVEADSREQAREDALELVNDVSDWEDIDYDASVVETSSLPWQRYWSGGQEGEWKYP